MVPMRGCGPSIYSRGTNASRSWYVVLPSPSFPWLPVSHLQPSIHFDRMNLHHSRHLTFISPSFHYLPERKYEPLISSNRMNLCRLCQSTLSRPQHFTPLQTNKGHQSDSRRDILCHSQYLENLEQGYTILLISQGNCIQGFPMRILGVLGRTP